MDANNESPPPQSQLSQSLAHTLSIPDYLVLYLHFFNPIMDTRILTTAACITFLIFVHRWRCRKLPPGPWGWPMIGNLGYILQNPHLKLSFLRDKYGDVVSLRVGSRLVVVLNSLEAILQGLVEKGEATSNRPAFQSFGALYRTSRNQGLCTSDMDEQASLRKQFINTVIEVYCSDASRIEDKVSSEIVNTINHISEMHQPFDPAPVLELACMNVSLNMTFSQRFDPMGPLAKDALETFQLRSAMFCFVAADFVPLLNVFHADDRFDYVRDRTAEQIDRHRRFLNFHKDTYSSEMLRDFTDQLLLFVESGEDRGLFTNEDIDYILLDMAGFGFQTTAVTLTWLLGYMALHQEVQRQVHEEIDTVVGRDRLPSLEDQPYLPFTEAVIFEVERLASVKPLLIPHSANQNIVIQGHEVPFGSVILFNVWGLHHDSRYWPNPFKFDPRRFLNNENALEIPDHFLPYGAGVRQCPGESLADIQLFLFFANLMHQLHIVPLDKNFRMESTFDYLLRPKPFQIIAVERDHS